MASYYVSQVDGNDGYNGLYPTWISGTDGPWLTLGKADDLTGDQSDNSVLLNRGDGPWRETATIGCYGTSDAHRFTWTAYGTGDLPKIYGSDQLTTWTVFSGNIWQCSHTGAIVGVFFNESGTIKWGAKKASAAACVAEYDWFSDATTTYCYAATDPDARYTSVEGTYRQSGVYGDGKDYITIDNLDVEFGSLYGIRTTGQGNYWLIQNNTVAYIGGVKNSTIARGIFIEASTNATIQYNVVHDSSMQGIFVWSGASLGASSGALVQHNEVYDCYHSEIDFICGNNGVLNGGTIRYNLIYKTSNFDITVLDGSLIYVGEGQDADDVLENIDVYYNIGFNVATKFIQVWSYCDNIHIWNNTCYGSIAGVTPIGGIRVDPVAGSTNIEIKNNIVMDVAAGCLWANAAGVTAISACENNLWYQSGGGTNVYVHAGAGDYHFDDQDAYQAATGWDTNGKWQDPLFVNAGGLTAEDYKLAPNSPCRDTGVNVSLTEDYWGTAIPQGAGYDIGAHEYVETQTKIYLTWTK